jgi:hypothetical protein
MGVRASKPSIPSTDKDAKPDTAGREASVKMTTTTNIIVLGSKPYPKIRRARKKNKRTKNTHFQRSSYVR